MNPFSLTLQKLSLRLRNPWQLSRTRSANTAENILLEVRSPEGRVGFGEAAPIARYGESSNLVQSALSGIDITRLATQCLSGDWRAIDEIPSTAMSARAAVELALLDLFGKNLAKPVHDVIGLPFREKHHRTSFTIGIDEPDVIRAKLKAAAHFPILKIKVGGPRDREVLRALKEIAPTKTLRLDANEGWQTKEQALKMLEWWATDSVIELVEQPMPTSTRSADWAWLKNRSPIPIFADESYHTAADANRAGDCFHGVNVKLAKAGGIHGAREALQAAKKAGLKTMLGSMIETSVSISAAAHLAELSDYLDLDGNLLVSNDPFVGVGCENGVLSFDRTPEKFGLRVRPLAEVANLSRSHAEPA